MFTSCSRHTESELKEENEDEIPNSRFEKTKATVGASYNTKSFYSVSVMNDVIVQYNEGKKQTNKI